MKRDVCRKGGLYNVIINRRYTVALRILRLKRVGEMNRETEGDPRCGRRGNRLRIVVTGSGALAP